MLGKKDIHPTLQIFDELTYLKILTHLWHHPHPGVCGLSLIASLLFLKNYTAATFNDNKTLLSPIILESAINPSPSVMSPYKFTSKTHSLSTEDLGKIFIDSFIHLSTRWEPFYLCKRLLQARQGRVLPFAMEIVFMVFFLQC